MLMMVLLTYSDFTQVLPLLGSSFNWTQRREFCWTP